MFHPLPSTAAWLHRDARSGFEVVYFGRSGENFLVEGRTAAVEAGNPWVVDYAIVLDAQWRTRQASATSRTTSGSRSTHLDSDGNGHWIVDGVPAPLLDGCLDVDLEASAFTNALPVHRLSMNVGRPYESPAAFIRAADVSVTRLEQSYTRMNGNGHHYAYSAPAFDFACDLSYDDSGLLLDYPGIAVRAL